jgi:hypothetical protein
MAKILFVVLSAFPVFALAQSDSSYFTVRLSTFDISLKNNIPTLHWKTVCYLEYAQFQIQRSANGTDYTTINSFTADRVRCLQPFDFADSTRENQSNLFYRIRVGDVDGAYYHSAVRRIAIATKSFHLQSLYPTIVSDNFTFTVTDEVSESFRSMIIDQRGALIKVQQHRTINGISNYDLDASQLPAGYYLLKIVNEKGNSGTARFLKK